MDLSPTLFLVWREPVGAPHLVESLARVLRALPGAQRALAFRPIDATPDASFADDGAPPALTLELGFADLEALEGAAPLLADYGADGRSFEAQAMLGRRFATPDPAFQLEPSAQPCSLLVAYPGQCENLDAWLDHYDANHPPIMVRFPAIRDVATFRPLAEAQLPPNWARAKAMQRNKVVFDSYEALRTALASPVRGEMRADFEAFPAFTGKPTHFATHTFDLLDARR